MKTELLELLKKHKDTNLSSEYARELLANEIIALKFGSEINNEINRISSNYVSNLIKAEKNYMTFGEIFWDSKGLVIDNSDILEHTKGIF